MTASFMASLALSASVDYLNSSLQKCLRKVCCRPRSTDEETRRKSERFACVHRVSDQARTPSRLKAAQGWPAPRTGPSPSEQTDRSHKQKAGSRAAQAPTPWSAGVGFGSSASCSPPQRAKPQEMGRARLAECQHQPWKTRALSVTTSADHSAGGWTRGLRERVSHWSSRSE